LEPLFSVIASYISHEYSFGYGYIPEARAVACTRSREEDDTAGRFILVPTSSASLVELGAGRVVVRVMTCILVSGSGSTDGVEVDDVKVGSDDVVEEVSLPVSRWRLDSG
jgi:hypothetical protein